MSDTDDRLPTDMSGNTLGYGAHADMIRSQFNDLLRAANSTRTDPERDAVLLSGLIHLVDQIILVLERVS